MAKANDRRGWDVVSGGRGRETDERWTVESPGRVFESLPSRRGGAREKALVGERRPRTRAPGDAFRGRERHAEDRGARATREGGASGVDRRGAFAERAVRARSRRPGPAREETSVFFGPALAGAETADVTDAHLIAVLLHVLLRAGEDLLGVLLGLGLRLGVGGGLLGGPRVVALATLEGGLRDGGLRESGRSAERTVRFSSRAATARERGEGVERAWRRSRAGGESARDAPCCPP